MITTDQIRKTTVLRAPQTRVWEAISDSSKFGYWFGMRIDGPFEPGKRLKMIIEPTKVDPEVAREQEPYRGVDFDVWIEDVQPETRFSFRWQPYALDEGVDPEDAPCTLIEFLLEPADGGTRLTVTESGFDSIPLEKRAKTFADNEKGWNMQIELIRKYVEL